MIYLDTSVLIALHTREPLTSTLQDWYDDMDSTPVVTAAWTTTEFASALGLKQRTRQMTTRQASIAWQSFVEQCSVALHLIDVERGAFVDAAELVRSDTGGLRAGDALHLAVARRAGIARLASLDLVMSRAARDLGIAAVDFAT